METLKGFITEIVYQSPQTGYTVAHLQTLDKEETIVGSMPTIDDGENLELTGEWTEHKIYGPQFKVSSYVSVMPEDEVSMIRYLGSGVIRGIGPTLASRIVKEFGEDTFRVIEREPERLSRIKGITLRKAQEIGVMMQEKQGFRDALIFLQKYGVGNTLALKIYSFYQERIYSIIQENPYKLAEDIHGVGFKTADEIARRVGVNKDSDYRIRSGILYTLSLATSQGNMYLPEDALIEKTAEIIDVLPEAIEPHILNLAADRKIFMEAPKAGESNPGVYAAVNYRVEKSVAALLRTLTESFEEQDVCDANVLRRSIEKICDENGLILDDIQTEAVLLAVQNKVAVITGGPGTGKTTTINTLISYFEKQGMDIALTAPTGRAAKRMTEATGCEAFTIHRLLGLSGVMDEDASDARFEHDADNPLEYDVIIVDEMSMVDVFLFRSLLMAVMPGTHLILVGDANQLPSVGPGQVLKDLIECECFPVTKLQKIYRQEGSGDIVENAHRIHNGEALRVRKDSRDFFFLERNDTSRILANLVELIVKMLPGYVDATPMDIQVLTPTRKGALGVEALNGYLQDRLNPPEPGKHERLFRETLFREGDKVMQVKNNYKLEWEIIGKYNIPIDAGVGVFNGDLGRIESISEPMNTVTVLFDDGRKAEYAFSDMDELELAYAITVHKSQGSEYDAVVMPILQGPRQLMNRNLLYTGVTRAKKCLVIMGSGETVEQMIANNHENRRFSGLKERIVEVYGQ